MKIAIEELVATNKHDLNGPEDLEMLIRRFSDCKIVMVGEASHGTHEYYNWRARISRKLIEEHGFDFVAVEGDWPACYQLNRYVKNYEDSSENTEAAMQNFQRWPQWMWANWEVYEWAEWIKDFNKNRAANDRAGFYGLDVYSLWESLDAIVEYLKKEDPDALKTAREAMQCFEPHRGEDGQRYARSTYLVPEGCQKEVMQMLREIRNKISVYDSDREHVFSTEQNAYVAQNAEEYYRTMVRGGGSTWNMRDRHMMETLNRLLQFHGEDAKAIVWAHNTHIGDARYTDMADDGLFNIGQLAREEFGEENVGLIGFGSYEGTVIAGDDWGADQRPMLMPVARKDSWEEICHNAGREFFIFSDEMENHETLHHHLDHRAVGVVYHPNREKYGNYVPTIIPKRYDAFVFINTTRALHPIPVDSQIPTVPDTYPFGM